MPVENNDMIWRIKRKTINYRKTDPHLPKTYFYTFLLHPLCLTQNLGKNKFGVLSFESATVCERDRESGRGGGKRQLCLALKCSRRSNFRTAEKRRRWKISNFEKTAVIGREDSRDTALVSFQECSIFFLNIFFGELEKCEVNRSHHEHSINSSFLFLKLWSEMTSTRKRSTYAFIYQWFWRSMSLNRRRLCNHHSPRRCLETAHRRLHCRCSPRRSAQPASASSDPRFRCCRRRDWIRAWSWASPAG